MRRLTLTHATLNTHPPPARANTHTVPVMMDAAAEVAAESPTAEEEVPPADTGIPFTTANRRFRYIASTLASNGMVRGMTR